MSLFVEVIAELVFTIRYVLSAVDTSKVPTVCRLLSFFFLMFSVAVPCLHSELRI
jgi:hypothetical protein